MELKIKKKTTLGELEHGSLFFSEDKTTLALKSEYHTGDGASESHIIGSGEMFWGGTKTTKEQLALIVWEVEVVKETKKISQQEQVQYDLTHQLKELRVVANRLGFYDAVDYLKPKE